ncbi:hypothetical protein [Parapedobacter defluvii]|uniref:hypothetical protein n=1 Tax=Parapedobacter defluvii TaxID=2045106 RepID=UPI00333E8571
MKTLNHIIRKAMLVLALFAIAHMGMANQPVKKAAIPAPNPAAAYIAKFIQSQQWFEVSSSNNNPTDHSNQTVTNQPEEEQPSGTCRPSYSGNICSVELDISGITDMAAYNALLARIGTSNPPKVSEFIALGASFIQAAKQFVSGVDTPEG